LPPHCPASVPPSALRIHIRMSADPQNYLRCILV
jgi:hypothetical protein